MIKNNLKLLSGLIFGILFIICFIGLVSALTYGYSGYSSYISPVETRGSWQTYYGGKVSTYWPILSENNRDDCRNRQDIILQVAPAGCQPAVVRSDLLAEQNVPVFCQINSMQINPLINIKEIENIRFSGNYPKSVVDVGFHPARAALRTNTALLGSPLLNNIGYVVVVLRRGENESALPDMVNLTLQAQIQYDSGNFLGVGKSEYVLEPVSDSDWDSEKNKNSFWQGRYFVRLEEFTPAVSSNERIGSSFTSTPNFNNARVSIYNGDLKIGSVSIPLNGKSSIPLPGSYCRAELNIYYDGFVEASRKARIEVGDGEKLDSLDLYQGMQFLNGKCRILNINQGPGTTGNVTINCGGKIFSIGLQTGASNTFLNESLGIVIPSKSSDGKTWAIDFGGNMGRYELNENNKLVRGGKVGVDAIAGDSESAKVWLSKISYISGGNTKEIYTNWLKELESSLIKYKNDYSANPGRPSLTLAEPKWDDESEKRFQTAIDAYREVVKKYPADKPIESSGNPFGFDALKEAIDLAGYYGKMQTKASLIDEFIKTYPSSSEIVGLKNQLSELYKVDGSLASGVIDIDGRLRAIRLISVESPSLANTPKASFVYGNSPNPLDVRIDEGKKHVLEGKKVDVRMGGQTISFESEVKNDKKTDSVKLNPGRAYLTTSNIQGGFEVNVSNSSGSRVYYRNTLTTVTDFALDITKSENYQIYINGTGKVTIRQSSTNSEVDAYIEVTKVAADYAEVKSNCADFKQGRMKIGDSLTLCGSPLVLKNTEVKQVAKIRLEPNMQNTETTTNLSVAIGIEKRAIKLSPEKTKEKIDRLNESIKKWETISGKLATVVKGMKTACFGTAAILTFKNFMSGLDGKTLARQEVMKGDNGWTQKCKDMIAQGTKGYKTLSECYYKEADNIEKDVSATEKAISQVNGRMKSIEDKYVTGGSSFMGDKSIDQVSAKKDLAKEIRDNCGNTNIGLSQNYVYGNSNSAEVNTLLADGNLDNVPYLDMRNIYMNCMRQKQGFANSAMIQSSLRESGNRINDQMILSKGVAEAKNNSRLGLPSPIFAGSGSAQLAQVVDYNNVNEGIKGQLGWTDVDAVAQVSTSGTGTLGEKGGNTGFTSGNYVLGLKKIPGSNNYNIVKAARIENGQIGEKYEDRIKVSEFQQAYKLGTIMPATTQSYHNSYKNPQVRYYETEPYKGMPAVVPLDIQNGWYAGTRQTLPTFGGIGAFDASGRVSSFWLCNVGANQLEDFDSGLKDDICQQFNLNTGQSTNMFPGGLSQQETQALVNKAQKALEEAARQYSSGVRQIRLSGIAQPIEVGAPSFGTPGTQCQDFMSPQDCHILFNVCDPVICPNSRCNLGGTFNVANVVQSGLVGSIFLCLPNIKEGIFIPVCLTGIQAGIDSYISIMKNHRDCLQESLKSGKMIGICDQIYSIYLCEFFWKQVAPIVNVILPKMIEYAYTGGQGARGGGEYLTVMGAWQNMQNSVDYFTQTYAVNSMNSFRARSTEEVGTELCKVFISATGPKSFQNLIEPDSPPQFYAWFSASTFTTATVPATSQYKVFYHIFGGKDSGVYYSVYLRNPPGTSYYQTMPTVTVATGFIKQGEYASETRDFTAPEGYKELCVRVNNDEECGFKQVTTDFAVNYLSDKAAQNEIENKNINSEKACVSGEASALSIMNPNLQQMAEEAANPAIYNRGIVRVCATANPGSSVDPTRFVNVGNCGDPKVICWLDKKSVSNAITDANAGVRNETLKNLEDTQLAQIEKGSEFLRAADASGEIQSLRIAKGALVVNTGSLKSAEEIVNRVDFILTKVFLNSQKAELLLIKAQVYDKIARAFVDKARDDRVLKVNAADSAKTAAGRASGSSGSASGSAAGSSGSASGNCGNGVLDEGEACDLTAPMPFLDKTCESETGILGSTGDLSCVNCVIYTDGCRDIKINSNSAAANPYGTTRGLDYVYDANSGTKNYIDLSLYILKGKIYLVQPRGGADLEVGEVVDRNGRDYISFSYNVGSIVLDTIGRDLYLKLQNAEIVDDKVISRGAVCGNGIIESAWEEKCDFMANPDGCGNNQFCEADCKCYDYDSFGGGGTSSTSISSTPTSTILHGSEYLKLENDNWKTNPTWGYDKSNILYKNKKTNIYIGQDFILRMDGTGTFTDTRIGFVDGNFITLDTGVSNVIKNKVQGISYDGLIRRLDMAEINNKEIVPHS